MSCFPWDSGPFFLHLNGHDRGYQRPGEIFDVCCVKQHNQLSCRSVIFWDGIKPRKGDISCFVANRLNAFTYRDTLYPTDVVNFMYQHRPAFTFQQAAGPHRDSVSIIFYGQQSIECHCFNVQIIGLESHLLFVLSSAFALFYDLFENTILLSYLYRPGN